MKKAAVKGKNADFPEEEEMYGPFTRLGIDDPHHATEITFVKGKYQGRSGMYLEKLDVKHRVVVYAGPRERTDVVLPVWEHTFKIKGFDGDFCTFEQAEVDRETAANNRRQVAGLKPLGEGVRGRARPVTPDREDQLVEQIIREMRRLGFKGPIPDRVVERVNRRSK